MARRYSTASGPDEVPQVYMRRARSNKSPTRNIGIFKRGGIIASHEPAAPRLGIRLCLLPILNGDSGQECGSVSIGIPANVVVGPGVPFFLEVRYWFALRIGRSTCRISSARWLPIGLRLSSHMAHLYCPLEQHSTFVTCAHFRHAATQRISSWAHRMIIIAADLSASMAVQACVDQFIYQTASTLGLITACCGVSRRGSFFLLTSDFCFPTLLLAVVCLESSLLLTISDGYCIFYCQ